MTADEAEDWLSVAIGEVTHYPATVLRDATAQVRKTCTHHAQIIAALAKAADAIWAEKTKYSEYEGWHRQIAQHEPRRIAPRKMTQADVSALPDHLRDLGLTLGFLMRDPAGNVVMAPDHAA